MLSAHAIRHVMVAAIPLFLLLASAAPVLAHEGREVAGYEVEVGFIDEPVYVGGRSGLELFVNKAGAPVEGFEATVKAEVIVGEQKRDLPLSTREGEPGAYQSVFIPTAAGPYTFHLTGAIEGTAIDESFTSSPEGFNEVQEADRPPVPRRSRPSPSWRPRRRRARTPPASWCRRSSSAPPVSLSASSRSGSRWQAGRSRPDRQTRAQGRIHRAHPLPRRPLPPHGRSCSA